MALKKKERSQNSSKYIACKLKLLHMIAVFQFSSMIFTSKLRNCITHETLKQGKLSASPLF